MARCVIWCQRIFVCLLALSCQLSFLLISVGQGTISIPPRLCPLALHNIELFIGSQNMTTPSYTCYICLNISREFDAISVDKAETLSSHALCGFDDACLTGALQHNKHTWMLLQGTLWAIQTAVLHSAVGGTPYTANIQLKCCTEHW